MSTYKKLGSALTVGAQSTPPYEAVLYKVPPGKQAIISNITVQNMPGYTDSITIAIRNQSYDLSEALISQIFQTSTADQCILLNHTISETLILEPGIVLDDTQQILISSGNDSTLVAHVFGAEV
jgi:hypothetical protein